MRANWLVILLIGGACVSADDALKEGMVRSEPIEAEYEIAARRTKEVLRRWFRHLDPDRTDEDAGDFWTIWNIKRGVFYRDTVREKAHVTLTRDEEGVLVAVAVVRQTNENIENPDVAEEARWVNTQRDPEFEEQLLRMITRDYRRNLDVSEHFKEKEREKRRKGLRPDLVDRYRDVDLTEAGEIDPDRDPGRPKDWGEKKYRDDDDD